MNNAVYMSTASTTDDKKVVYCQTPDRIIRLFRLQRDLKEFNVTGAWKHFAMAIVRIITEEFPETLDKDEVVLSAAMPARYDVYGLNGKAEWTQTVYRCKVIDDMFVIGYTDRKDNGLPKASLDPDSEKDSGISIGTGVNYMQVVTGADADRKNLCWKWMTDKDDWWDDNGFNMCGALIGTLHELSDKKGPWYSRAVNGYEDNPPGTFDSVSTYQI